MSGLVERVELGSRAYDVRIGGSLAGLGGALAGRFRAGRALVVTDSRVSVWWGTAVDDELTSAGLQVAWIEVPDGEIHKHQATWWSIVEGLLAARPDRHTPVVALGGGVIGDLAGFAAAVTLRGLPLVQVPTTLLAMVDSSVGGKTGFNHDAGKNLVGAFYQPRLVWAATETLSTLDDRERRSALAEVVKHALIDGDWLDWLEANATALRDGEAIATAEVVRRSVRCKAAVVAADELETGRREVLNLGHTVGHAIEAVAGFGAMPHGEAVGLGLIAEQAWAERAGLAEPGLTARLVRLLDALGLPTSAPSLSADAMNDAMGLDKKAEGATLRLPVCASPGVVSVVPIGRERARELLGVS